MNENTDMEIVRSIMFEPGTPNTEARDRARARLIADADSGASGRSGRFDWLRRKVVIGGIGVPTVALVIVATAAAATGSIIAVNATTLFENNPQQALNPSPPATARAHHGAAAPGLQQTVIPASVREFASASVPDYGEVQFWGAPTKQGGFCFAIKLPDGSWGGYPLSLHPTGRWVGGSVPGCTSTQQHDVVSEPVVRAGQQPTSERGDVLEPTPVEEWQQDVRSKAGQIWALTFGYVEVQGTATRVRDPANDMTAAVTSGGYFLLIEPSSNGGDDLQVLNDTGQTLKPDYTYGKLVPGHQRGPSQS